MIISFSGTAGSGKSTIAKMLADKLGWPRYYIGGIRRQVAKERGMTLEEYNALGEKDPSTDTEVDEYQKRLGETKDNFIIEGRTSWFFIPHSIKIFIDVDEREGAQRIFFDTQKNSQRNEANDLNSAADVLAAIRTRVNSDKKRYKKYYNIDVFGRQNYDLYIDSTNKNPQQVMAEVCEYLRKYIKI